MTDIKLTSSLGLTPRTYTLAFGPDLTMQRVRLRLSVHRGEWFQDPERGLPWLEWLGRRGFRDAEILDPIRAEILSVPGVIDVLELDLDRGDGGDFKINGRILVQDSVAQVVRSLGLDTFGVGRVRVF